MGVLFFLIIININIMDLNTEDDKWREIDLERDKYTLVDKEACQFLETCSERFFSEITKKK